MTGDSLGCNEHGDQDPKKSKWVKMQAHNPGLQENRLWIVQGPVWKNAMGYVHGEKRNTGEFVDIQGPHSSNS